MRLFIAKLESASVVGGSGPHASAAGVQTKMLPVDPPAPVRARIQGLMTRYALGHRDAFDPLFQLLWPLVRDFTHRALSNRADADDAAQDALLKVFARIAEYDSQRDALGWALGIAYYEVRTLRRRRQRRREDDAQKLQGLPSPDQPSAEEQTIARDLSEALSAALSELPETDRELLSTLICEAAPAQESDASDVAVRKRRQRARERLREVWRKLYGSF